MLELFSVEYHSTDTPIQVNYFLINGKLLLQTRDQAFKPFEALGKIHSCRSNLDSSLNSIPKEMNWSGKKTIKYIV